MNSSIFYTNGTENIPSINQAYQITVVVFFILSFLIYGFFLYLIVTILAVYFSNSHVRENSRYILFAHMLINDAMYLSLGLFLSVAFQFLYFPAHFCYFLIAITAATFRITPYNLAVMALERYFAIAFPLHYSIFWTVQRAFLAIAMMWIIAFIPNLADLFVLLLSVHYSFFYQSRLCKQEHLIALPVQEVIRSSTFIGSLLLVALVILFTYIKVWIIARKTGSSSSTASKAGKTLLIHAVQLLLCIISLISNITEAYGGDFVIMANFFIFMCVPRLLSPLIYGIRDEVLKKCIRKMYFKMFRQKQEAITK